MIAKNIKDIRQELAKRVVLVAVTKTKPIRLLQEAYETDCLDFGENYVQELVDKQAQLPKDIRWHFIGHLQSNKVKYIAPFVYLIHSVDSLKLLQEINRQAAKNDRKIACLLQIYIAQEESKTGMSEEECLEIFEHLKTNSLPHIEIVGLMGMASFSDKNEQIRQEMKNLKQFFDKIKAQYSLSVLSMGMSSDYAIALEEGSNMVRIGSAIFGSR